MDGDGKGIRFYVSDPRAVLPIGAVRVPRTVARALRRTPFELRVDADFAGVLAGCSEPRAGQGEWLSPELAGAYKALHERGLAHSFEVWHDGALAAGLFGLTIGGLVTSESMFHRVPDAGNALIVLTSAYLGEAGFRLWDIQMMSTHLARFGAESISAEEYLRRLAVALGS